jgi:hypothetical protein
VSPAPTLTRVAALAVLVASGCSASARIAQSANDIRASTDRIVSASERLPPSDDASVIRESALEIREAVADIHANIPGVTDVIPWWSHAIRYGLIALIVLGVVYALHASGLLLAMRVAIGWLPRKVRTDAEMLRSVLDDAKPETIREYVAMRRGNDPAFSRAFEDTKKPE